MNLWTWGTLAAALGAAIIASGQTVPPTPTGTAPPVSVPPPVVAEGQDPTGTLPKYETPTTRPAGVVAKKNPQTLEEWIAHRNATYIDNQKVAIPTDKSAQYKSFSYTYSYEVANPGTPQEVRKGTLYHFGNNLDKWAKPGEFMRTPWGFMQFDPAPPSANGWLLSLPGNRPLSVWGQKQVLTPQAIGRASLVSKDLDHFQMVMGFAAAGGQEKLPNVDLHVQNTGQTSQGDWLYAKLSKQEAAKLVDHLQWDGFFDESHDRKDPRLVTKLGKGYIWQVMTNRPDGKPLVLEQHVGWNTWLLFRLESLAQSLGNQSEAGKAMNTVAEQAKQYQQQLRQGK